MKFLTVLIIIFFYRNWIGDNPVRDALPFDRWADWFRENLASASVRFVLCVGIPVVIVGLLSVELWYWILGLPWLILAIAVMAFSIDIVDADALFDEHAQWLQQLPEDASLDEVRERQSAFKLAAVYEVFQSLYPALFWFLVLGPAGALLYTLSRAYLEQMDESDAEIDLVDRVVYWLEWPAAKINGFLFALVGHFGDCFEEWFGSLFDTEEPVGENLVIAACAAAAHEETGDSLPEFVRTSQEHNNLLKDLLGRTSYGWLGLAALVTIFGF